MQQRLLVTHGTLDPLIPFDMARGQVGELKAAGLNVEWREFTKAHTIAEDELAVIRDFVRAGYSGK
jgi:phospholipase/carboxylesterase